MILDSFKPIKLIFQIQYATAYELWDGAGAISRRICKIYPHVFDENLRAGQANVHIHNALRDAQLAVEAFGEPDLQAVVTYLGQIAAAMGSAYPLTEFNESLGGVVAFVRRATLAASSAELSRSALNALVYALQSLVSNPMLDLDEASDFVDKLANEGWQGEHKVADELVVRSVNIIAFMKGWFQPSYSASGR